ncbi:MAG: hypothetical protein EP338_01250 [Bacteroidetes bacterium]|nr:MAG: hypothetical protein EP338_01250 [Bacteroidota bacterium]
MRKGYQIALCATLLLTACDNPNEWTEERKQIVKDKCDNDLYDCDCFLEKTVNFFPEAQDYNKTLENESENQEKVDSYWEELDACMKE